MTAGAGATFTNSVMTGDRSRYSCERRTRQISSHARATQSRLPSCNTCKNSLLFGIPSKLMHTSSACRLAHTLAPFAAASPIPIPLSTSQYPTRARAQIRAGEHEGSPRGFAPRPCSCRPRPSLNAYVCIHHFIWDSAERGGAGSRASIRKGGQRRRKAQERERNRRIHHDTQRQHCIRTRCGAPASSASALAPRFFLHVINNYRPPVKPRAHGRQRAVG